MSSAGPKSQLRSAPVSDYVYYGLPDYLRDDGSTSDGFDVDIGDPTIESSRPDLLK